VAEVAVVEEARAVEVHLVAECVVAVLGNVVAVVVVAVLVVAVLLAVEAEGASVHVDEAPPAAVVPLEVAARSLL